MKNSSLHALPQLITLALISSCHASFVLPSGIATRVHTRKQNLQHIPNLQRSSANYRKLHLSYMNQLSFSSNPNNDNSNTFISTSTSNNEKFKIRTKFYEHDGWKLSYKHKEAISTSATSSPPLLLIHPVGIGLSSWFWDRIINDWEGEVYAPDLIGCSLDGGDTWDPNQRGLFLPLDWVRGCETLLNEIIEKSCIVVTQGGLAPVGVMLTHRNSQTTPDGSSLSKSSFVSGLVLTSPPAWKDMITPIPESELARNYDFLRSPIWGSLAFNILETKWAVQFFSNLFLFEDDCDVEWLTKALSFRENISLPRQKLRPPIFAFNAGLLNHRSYEEDMKEITQPTIILSGTNDKRVENRYGYMKDMQNCSLKSIKGCNVLPWENAQGICDTITDFCNQNKLV